MYIPISINNVIKNKIMGPFFMPANMPKLTPVFSTHTMLKNGKTVISFPRRQTFCITWYLEKKSTKNPNNGIMANTIIFCNFIY